MDRHGCGAAGCHADVVAYNHRRADGGVVGAEHFEGARVAADQIAAAGAGSARRGPGDRTDDHVAGTTDQYSGANACSRTSHRASSGLVRAEHVAQHLVTAVETTTVGLQLYPATGIGTDHIARCRRCAAHDIVVGLLAYG